MRLHAAEPRSTEGVLFPSQYLCGTIFHIPQCANTVWEHSVGIQCGNTLSHTVPKCGTDRFQEQGQYLFIGLAARTLFISYSFSPHSPADGDACTPHSPAAGDACTPPVSWWSLSSPWGPYLKDGLLFIIRVRTCLLYLLFIIYY